jgi:hypothetical protein
MFGVGEMKRILDIKTSDQTTKGFDYDQIKNWLSGIKNVKSLKYYYYAPGSKYPTESRNMKVQSVQDVLSFLASHFTESPNAFVEVQRKVFRSGKQEIILRAITSWGETMKIGVLEVKKAEG